MLGEWRGILWHWTGPGTTLTFNPLAFQTARRGHTSRSQPGGGSANHGTAHATTQLPASVVDTLPQLAAFS